MALMVVFCTLVCAVAAHFIPAVEVVIRASTLVGAPRAVPENRTDVRRTAQFAVDEFNRGNVGDIFAYKILNITSAETQVVAGINYILEVQIGRTLCKKGNPETQSCGFKSGSKKLQCHFIVNEIPWEGASVLEKEKCAKLY